MITVLHLITGLEAGGAETMLSRLVRGSDKARFRSVVVSMTDAGALGCALVEAGIALHTLGMRRGLPDPRGLWRLGRIMRQYRPDILQTWLYHADLLGLAAWRLGLAPHLIWNLRCTDMSGDGSRLNALARRLLSRFSHLPDAIVVNAASGRCAHEAIGYHPRRWVCLPNGFDTTLLQPSAASRATQRARLGFAEADIVIALPARYDPMKDHANFLAAAAVLSHSRPAARFVLAGSGAGPANAALAGEIARHGISDRLRLLGRRDDMAALYPAFDIVTLSSAYGEGFPNVLGEAMACGVTCVATDIGDCAGIIGETGAVVPPRDPAALSAAWERLIAIGADGRAALGVRGRARIVENYELSRILDGYAALYEDVADRAARRHPAGEAAPVESARIGVAE